MVEFAAFSQAQGSRRELRHGSVASAAQVMMTYMPLYCRTLWAEPRRAGIGIAALCAYLCSSPRIAVLFQGRSRPPICLTFGLGLAAPATWRWPLWWASHLPYGFVALGMVGDGCGAGAIKGAGRRKSQTSITPERGGHGVSISGRLSLSAASGDHCASAPARF